MASEPKNVRNPREVSEPRGPEIQEILDLLLRDVLKRLTAALGESAPFATLHEATGHLAFGLNALKSFERQPDRQQEGDVWRLLLVEMAVTSLKAVCNLYPEGGVEEEAVEGSSKERDGGADKGNDHPTPRHSQ